MDYLVLHSFNRGNTNLRKTSMFDWISNIFKSKTEETISAFIDAKKRSDDDFMTQTLTLASANHALRPNTSSDHSDEGSSDGGSSAGD